MNSYHRRLPYYILIQILSFNTINNSIEIFFIQNTELKPSFVESTQVICKHYGIPVIQLKDIKKQAGHPNIEGMQAIAKQVLEQVQKALR